MFAVSINEAVGDQCRFHFSFFFFFFTFVGIFGEFGKEIPGSACCLFILNFAQIVAHLVDGSTPLREEIETIWGWWGAAQIQISNMKKCHHLNLTCFETKVMTDLMKLQ
jgi:hypothetical protein